MMTELQKIDNYLVLKTFGCIIPSEVITRTFTEMSSVFRLNY